MKEVIVDIQNLNLNYGKKAILKGLNWTIRKGEHWVLGGKSGSGKTSLANAIIGKIKIDGDIKINFNLKSQLPAVELLVGSWYQFTNIEGDKNFYYQQRYNHQQKKDTLTVGAELAKFGKEHKLSSKKLYPILKALNYTHVEDSQLIELSSGEHKKLQLVKAIWLKPQLLIIDQPYTGLDAFSRENFNDLLDQLVEAGTTLILISNDDELPTCINRFALICDGNLVEQFTHIPASLMPANKLKPLPDFLKEIPAYHSENIIQMENVSINYGEKQVLQQINWKVKAGERWLLQGHNGSGKSTLLSLITGDHPQAYANKIHLFDVKRGGGESIWDIKKKIGLISPEFHWYFDANATVLQSIASGLFDTNGLYQQLRFAEKQRVNELLYFFDLENDKDELLSTLPLGKQRLALLARTIIKNPHLLVLDEPCQGLDQQQTKYFNLLVDELSSNGMTVIYVGHFEAQLPNCIDHKLVLVNGKIEVTEEINTTIEEIIL
jgi:molybdate transport system ATP-binding protein